MFSINSIFVLIVGVAAVLFDRRIQKSLVNLPRVFCNAMSVEAIAGREERCLDYIRTNAEQGKPQSVLDAIDRFGWTQEWLMNVGETKGVILTDELLKKQPKNVLEIGAFVGYSGVRIGMSLPVDGHLTSVELSNKYAGIARQTVDYAGLSSKVTIVEGTVSTVLKDYVQSNGLPPFDFVFIDHAKDYYLSDLLYLLDNSLIAPGGIIVADNIIYPGAPDYREYVNGHPERFRTVEHLTKLEYSEKEDMVMVSELLH